MADVAAEYIAARRVLLDALDALAPQIDSFILVGAQAVYQQTGDVTGLGIPNTTDSDLALDTTLLSDDPELTEALQAQGFVPDRERSGDVRPGSWVGDNGIKVDLMSVPHQSNRNKKGARAADLPPHGRNLVRITRGLEPALVDHAEGLIEALDETDKRTYALKVAGPAALLSAKLIKLKERDEARQTGGKDRLKSKDVLDILRLLTGTETAQLIEGFVRHQGDEHARATSQEALGYLATQQAAGQESALRQLLASEPVIDPTALASYDALVSELLDALDAAELGY